jgi:hypothetical protein
MQILRKNLRKRFKKIRDGKKPGIFPTVPDHFVDANKMVLLGSGAGQRIEDLLLTRYACYLIAQNGDPRKGEIAFAYIHSGRRTRNYPGPVPYFSKL